MSRLSFRDTTIVFATNHGKAQAAEEPFKRVLNSVVTELVIDSDSLGTFTGEVERRGSMVDALRGKVQLARQSTHERFVLVSEGSFGSPTGLGFIAQGTEMLLLHDAVTGSEVLEQHLSWDTNYATAVLATQEELERFLTSIWFGSHGVVLYPHGISPKDTVYKGIFTREEAERAFALSLSASPDGRVFAMSDMRAHCNPTRMKSIAACCELLVNRLATTCPKCESGGFGIVASVPGLPCASCGCPTQRARAEHHACVVCHAHVEKPRSDGKTSVDPAECEFCNP
jgi:hypothetical protein